MSVAQIERELETLSLDELRAVEAAARRNQSRYHSNVLDNVETRLIEEINQPLPGGERLLELRVKRETRTLTDEELTELIQLDDEREVVWARKLRAVSELADYRGAVFDALYHQLGLHLRAEATP